MADHNAGKAESATSHEGEGQGYTAEENSLNYNCWINVYGGTATITVKQEGKPVSPPPPPGGDDD